MEKLVYELSYWINERWSIREKRAQGLPPPWSRDRIFNTVRFCNVHREDDRVTKWVRTHWNRADDPAWRFVVARMINWPGSLTELMDFTTPDEMLDVMKYRRARGHKVFTSAYTVSTSGRKMDKLDYVFNFVVPKVHVERYASLEETSFWLSETDGLGSFLAAQVIADMKNTVGHPLHTAPDWWTWSAPGPGSLRGLSWFFCGEPTGIPANDYWMRLEDCRELVDPRVDPSVPRISNQDFQNCLCEFSKWCKVKYLGGHVRNTYNPFSKDSQ